MSKSLSHAAPDIAISGKNPYFFKFDGFIKSQKNPSPLIGEGWGEGESKKSTLVSLRAKRSNLLQGNYLNLRDCFVVEFTLSIAEGVLAMTGEKTFYELIKIGNKIVILSRNVSQEV